MSRDLLLHSDVKRLAASQWSDLRLHGEVMLRDLRLHSGVIQQGADVAGDINGCVEGPSLFNCICRATPTCVTNFHLTLAPPTVAQEGGAYYADCNWCNSSILPDRSYFHTTFSCFFLV